MSRTNHSRSARRSPTDKMLRRQQAFHFLRNYFIDVAERTSGSRGRQAAVRWLAELEGSLAIPPKEKEKIILRRAITALTEGYFRP